LPTSTIKSSGDRKTRWTNRKIAALIIVVVLIVVPVEIYAHTYVEIHGLRVLTEDDALKLLPFLKYDLYTVNCTLSSSGCQWLFVWEIGMPKVSFGFAYVHIFKIGQNASFFVQGIDLAKFKLESTTNESDGWLEVQMRDISYDDNQTTLTVVYYFGRPGSYEVYFGLHAEVYEETLFGIFPKEEIIIPMTTTLSYNP
jgi:hypothetical protein